VKETSDVKAVAPPKSREWNSDVYHRVSGPQVSWGRKVMGRLSLRGDETVLDAGCGTGRLTRELLEQLPRGAMIAVDQSWNMVQAAARHLAAEFRGRINFVAADVQHLPFQSVFHGIFSTATFHWVPDHEQLFRSLFGALKPGGWLCAQCGGFQNLDRLLQRVTVLSQAPKYAPYLGSYQHAWVYSDAETAARQMKQAGFVEVETGLEAAPTPFAGEKEYCEFLENVVLHRHLERIPDREIRERFLKELAELAAQDTPPFALDYWRLNMRAHRPA